jgi:hypothetical protein
VTTALLVSNQTLVVVVVAIGRHCGYFLIVAVAAIVKRIHAVSRNRLALLYYGIVFFLFNATTSSL